MLAVSKLVDRLPKPVEAWGSDVRRKQVHGIAESDRGPALMLKEAVRLP